jgi:uncharacterized membrane protein
MNSTPNNYSDNQEIDLSQVSKKIGGFFENIATALFKAIVFFKKNLVVIAILLVAGALIGFYLDKTSKKYDNQIIVAPNFGSNDYLYDKINLLSSKIKDGDTLFLKNIVGMQNPKKLKKIEIKPINDVYKFIDNKKDNFELIKLMAEDGDIKKIIDDELTSKNYPFHEINYVTSEITSEEKTLQPILKYLNDSQYYSKLQKEYLNNIAVRIVANDSIIKQIDGVLNSFSGKMNNRVNDKMFYYNENTQLNDIIKTKNELVYEQGANRVQLVTLNKVIKDSSFTLNVINKTSVIGKLKILLPLLFLFIFIAFGVIKSFYAKQLAKSKL